MSVLEKSPDAFRTISEAAEELDVPAHVLRFWESKFAQISPLKRAGGRRFYRPQDLALLRGIKHLLYSEGFTIKGAKKFIKDNGVASIVELGKNPNRDIARAVDTADVEARQDPTPKGTPSGRSNREIKDVIQELEGARAKLKSALNPKI